MAFDKAKPMDDEYIAAGPAAIRENLRALKEDQIVDAGTVNGLAVGNASGNIPKANGTLCTNLNAQYLGGNPAGYFSPATHTHSTATTSSNGLMANTDKAKLDGIAAGAQVNQNAFAGVLVSGTTIQADAATDTLELVAGSNIALTPDATNDRITIGVTGTVPAATTAASCTGNAATATTLQTARTIGINGDATGTATSFNGSTNITIPVTLATSGVTAGTYSSVTVDAKGRVTGGSNPTTISANTTGNAATATTANAATTAITANVATTAATCTGNAATATKLAAVRTINITGAVAGNANFDGSANISINTTNSRILWDYTVPTSVATIDLPVQVISLLNSDDIPLEILFHLNVTGAADANYMFSIKPNVNGDSSYVNINNKAYSDIRDNAIASLLTIAHYDGLVSGAWPSGLPGVVFAKSTIYRKSNSINLIGLNAYHIPSIRAYSQPLLCQLFMNGTASNYTLGCYTNTGATVTNGVITAGTRIIVKRVI